MALASVSTIDSLSLSQEIVKTSTRTSENQNYMAGVATVVPYQEETTVTIAPSPAISTIIARPTIASTIGKELGYDWALIESSQFRISNIGNLIQTIPLDNVQKDVLVFTGHSGIVEGKVSPSSSMMKLSSRTMFQEVWSIKLESNIGKLQSSHGRIYVN